MKSFTSLLLLLLLSATALALPTKRHDAGCDASTTTPTSSSPPPPPPGPTLGASTGAAETIASAPSNATVSGINPALVPSFGVVPGTNADAQQAGSCDGLAAATGATVLIPCTCPPDRATFLEALARNVAAGAVEGNPIVFNADVADQSEAANRARGTALLVTLQNLNGPGRGCPAASAPNFAVLQTKGVFQDAVLVG